MITKKEKQQKAISKHSVIVWAARNGYTVAEIRLFFELNNLSYNVKTLRVAYYRTKSPTQNYWFKRSAIFDSDTEEKLRMKFAEVMFLMLCGVGARIHTSLDIQGDYETSINAVVDQARKNAY